MGGQIGQMRKGKDREESRELILVPSLSLDSRKRPTVSIDTSLEAHISRIQSTFEKASTPLSSLRHPTKPNLRAIDSYQVLPDRDTWSTSYQILKFVDWPGRTSQKDGKPLVDERITNGLFRPVMDSNGEQRMSLYLPSADGFEGEEMDDGKSKERKEDEMAARFSKRRRTGKFPKAKTQEEMNGELEGVEDEEEKIKLEEKEGQRVSLELKQMIRKKRRFEKRRLLPLFVLFYFLLLLTMNFPTSILPFYFC